MGAAGEEPGSGASAGVAALTLGALGIVFGDIGTSPLYAMKETFSGVHELRPDDTSVYGVLSLIFWAVTIIVSVKYLVFVMRADNHGEGGIMALISLVQESALRTRRGKFLLVALGAFGAALFYGDGMITPAISVLSAVEGLEVAAPGLEHFVVPITLVVLSSLFAIQRFGTSAVGRLFGPVMAVWFTTLAVLGLAELLEEPGVLRAMSPTYGVSVLPRGRRGSRRMGTRAPGSPVLVRPRAPRPAAQLLRRLRCCSRTRELRTTRLAFLGPTPLVLLATGAAIIASQAVISGAFSVTRQAVALGFLPHLSIRHTSEREVGQIYVPAVNWALLVAIAALVVSFGSSSALASAYGIAVTGTLAIDTVLFFVVVRVLWRKPLWMVLAGASGFLLVDLSFFAANVTKVLSGGWFPLLVGLVIFTILMTWRRGRRIVTRHRLEEEGPLMEFVYALDASDDPPIRVPGTAIFLHPKGDTTPLALRYNVEHNHVLHEHVVIFTVENVPVPHVGEDERLEIDDLVIPDDGISYLTARYGFSDEPDVPAALRLAKRRGLELDVEGASYFLSRITINATHSKGMRRWRKRLFTAMSRNAASPADYFRLPEDRVVSLGGSIDL